MNNRFYTIFDSIGFQFFFSIHIILVFPRRIVNLFFCSIVFDVFVQLFVFAMGQKDNKRVMDCEKNSEMLSNFNYKKDNRMSGATTSALEHTHKRSKTQNIRLYSLHFLRIFISFSLFARHKHHFSLILGFSNQSYRWN